MLLAEAQLRRLHVHPGVAENIAPVGGPGSEVIVEGIIFKSPARKQKAEDRRQKTE